MKTEHAGPLEALLNSTLRKVWRRLKNFVSPRTPYARGPSDDYESFASDLLEQMNRFFDTQGSQKVWFAVCMRFINYSIRTDYRVYISLSALIAFREWG